MLLRFLLLIQFLVIYNAPFSSAEQGQECLDVIYGFMNSSLKELERSLTAKIEEHNQKIEEQNQKTEEQNQKIVKQNQRIEEQNQEIEKQNQKIEEQNQKIHFLEQKVLNLTAQLEEKRTKENQVQVSLESVRTEIKLLSSRSFTRNPRTCEEIKAVNPFTQSGTFFIDPDGHGTGDDPIQVFCNMTTGSTEVLHDSEDAIKVSKCSSAGCYSRTIKYEASARQMEALISLSTSCRQHIQYDCVIAPLSLYGKAYAWWNDRNGSAQYYWSGSLMASNNSHICQCGIENSCVDPSAKCNCDSSAPEQLTDQGYITDMAALPVTKLNFGRILYSLSSGVHRLGRLECSGKPSPTKEASSCEDLWRNGHVLPAIYSVKDQGKLKSVYCDFNKLPNEKGFQKDIEIVGGKSAPVYFSLYRTSSYGNTGTVIPFEGVNVNAGGAVNSSGIFTAPVAGIYHFQFFGAKDSSGLSARVNLKRGSAILCTKYSYPSSYYASMATSVTVDLDAGETVYVYLNSGTIYSESDKWTIFNGMLLQQRYLP